MFRFENDWRLPEILFEEFQHNSENLQSDIEVMTCEMLERLDAKLSNQKFYIDPSEAFKGLKTKSEAFQLKVSEYVKFSHLK